MKQHHSLMVDPIVTHYCLWLLDLLQRSQERVWVLWSAGDEREKMYFTAETFILTIAWFLQAFHARADSHHSHQRWASVPLVRRVRDPWRRGVPDAPCWSAGRYSNAPRLLSCPNDDLRPAFNHYLCCLFIIFPLSCTIWSPEAWERRRWLTAL